MVVPWYPSTCSYSECQGREHQPELWRRECCCVHCTVTIWHQPQSLSAKQYSPSGSQISHGKFFFHFLLSPHRFSEMLGPPSFPRILPPFESSDSNFMQNIWGTSCTAGYTGSECLCLTEGQIPLFWGPHFGTGIDRFCGKLLTYIESKHDTLCLQGDSLCLPMVFSKDWGAGNVSSWVNWWSMSFWLWLIYIYVTSVYVND